jgi:hypothetical protein
MHLLRRARSLFGQGAMAKDGGRTTSTYEYSDVDLAALEKLHDDMQWIPYDSTELYMVKEEDDNKRYERVHFGFGTVCPLPLVNGVGCCKIFEKKKWYVKSCVSRKVAFNYLAKHAFECVNHPSCNNVLDSFAAAHKCPIIEEAENFDWRLTHRLHCLKYLEEKEQKKKEEDDKRDRSRSRKASDDERRKKEDAAFVQNKRDRSKSREAKREIRAQARKIKETKRDRDAALPRVNAQSASASSGNAAGIVLKNLGAMIPVAQYEKIVKVSTAELQVLEGCLGHAIDSQKRTVDALHFAARQIEDEKKVFIEAREVIKSLVDRARR